jgi:Putative beta-barrel porin-2, OmpL-like. bbp2
MSLKHLAAATVLAVCIFVTHVSAQKNEVSGLIGRTFISDQGIKGGTFFDNNVHFGKGLTFEGNYARRVLGPAFASLSLEVPVVVNWDEDLKSDALQIPKSFKSYFVTPSARLNVFSNSAVSPWVSLGGGIGRFSESSTQVSGASKTGTTTGALQVGLGLDVRFFGRFSLRGEVRDFWSGVPQLNVDTGKTRQHNYFVAGGVVWHF